jgi:hypothetical protein
VEVNAAQRVVVDVLEFLSQELVGEHILGLDVLPYTVSVPYVSPGRLK